jgi:hypothetical protein
MFGVGPVEGHLVGAQLAVDLSVRRGELTQAGFGGSEIGTRLSLRAQQRLKAGSQFRSPAEARRRVNGNRAVAQSLGASASRHAAPLDGNLCSGTVFCGTAAAILEHGVGRLPLVLLVAVTKLASKGFGRSVVALT